MPIPFNPDLHTHFSDLGFEYFYSDPEFDDGDPENGPGTWGCPAYNEYESASERIIVDHHGHVVHREDRDLALEAWLASWE